MKRKDYYIKNFANECHEGIL